MLIEPKVGSNNLSEMGHHSIQRRADHRALAGQGGVGRVIERGFCVLPGRVLASR